MKLFDVLASLVVVAMVFVALLLHMLSPKPSAQPVLPERSIVPEAPARALSLCKTLLQTAIDGDYKGFRDECFREGNSDMKLALAQAGARETFEQASATIAPLCREGYELQFLASMTQRGSEIFLWKLIPAAGQNQFLVRLAMKDGKVSGFFFQ